MLGVLLLSTYLLGNIIAMDETGVWADMVSDTTVDKTGTRTITMKSTGHKMLCLCMPNSQSGWIKAETIYYI